jgi:hypothetical protein
MAASSPREATLEEHLAEVSPERDVVGRALDCLAQRLELVHARQDGWLFGVKQASLE